jgi:hypothetical protein
MTAMCLHCSGVLDRSQQKELFVEQALKRHYDIGLRKSHK